MVYTEQQQNGEKGLARWELFAREDAPKLNDFLRERFGGIDPISEGDIEMTQELLADIESSLGIRPYTIHQHAGQAVIIPALAPHYVCFYAFASKYCHADLAISTG